MDFFSSRRVVTVILLILVVLNLVLLGVLWWQNFSPSSPDTGTEQSYSSKKSFFQEELDLTDDQSRKFNALRKEHFRGSIPVFIQIAAQKKQLIREALAEDPDVDVINTLSDHIGRNQAILERRLAWHFHSLARLCTPEQRDSLQLILENVTLKPRITARKVIRKQVTISRPEQDSTEHNPTQQQP